MLIPIAVDVPMERRPYANWAIMAVAIVCYVMQEAVWDVDISSPFVLGNGPLSYLTHMFLHAGPLHLAGNMLFLWVFGNAICAKVGNAAYVPLYLALGVLSAGVHMLFDGGPAVGASGAINGIVGVFLLWYPINDISCLYFFWIFVIIRGGRFEARAFWLILLWLLFDVLGAYSGRGGTAYFAHLGGFFSGAAIGLVLLLTGRVVMHYYEISLPVALGLMDAPPRPRASTDRVFGAYGVSTPEAQHLPLQARPVASADVEGVRFRCRCGRMLFAPAAMAGKVSRCPHCNAQLQVPEYEV